MPIVESTVCQVLSWALHIQQWSFWEKIVFPILLIEGIKDQWQQRWSWMILRAGLSQLCIWAVTSTTPLFPLGSQASKRLRSRNWIDEARTQTTVFWQKDLCSLCYTKLPLFFRSVVYMVEISSKSSFHWIGRWILNTLFSWIDRISKFGILRSQFF